MPEGLSSISESVIHFHSVANLSHPQEGARYTVPPWGPRGSRFIRKIILLFITCSSLKIWWSRLFFSQRICYCTQLFQPCLPLKSQLFAIFHFFIFLFCVLWAISNLLSKMSQKRGSLRPWFVSETLKHVDLDCTRSAPVDTGSWLGVAKRVSLDADVLDRILPFGFTLVRVKSVHLR